MKKGFTLIELLAVIVILAIIALIATPIILNIIGDSKKEVNERSVDLYASSVKNAVAKYQMKENKAPSNFSDIEKYIEYDGSEVICSTKELNSDGTIYLAGCTVNGEKVEYTYGKQQENNSTEINHLAEENVEAVTNPTINGAAVGTTPSVDSNGDLVPGSTFKIKVNDLDTDGSIFYVLSNDGEYVNLIAQQNITPTGEFTSEPQDNDEWYITSSSNRYGPQTAYTYLSTATSNWKNIPIIENFTYENELIFKDGYQSIVTALDNTSGKYITTITPYSTDFGSPVTYENMRARMPSYNEIMSNTSCATEFGSCPIWMANYTGSNDYYSTDEGKVNSIGVNAGYWTLSAYPSDGGLVNEVFSGGALTFGHSTNYDGNGIRPVITVLKSDLLRVMQ